MGGNPGPRVPSGALGPRGPGGAKQGPRPSQSVPHPTAPLPSPSSQSPGVGPILWQRQGLCLKAGPPGSKASRPAATLAGQTAFPGGSASRAPPRPFTRTAISAAERHPHWGPHDPALISPLEPKRPRSDQGGRLGALGAGPRGQSSLRAGLHRPGGQGLSRGHMGRSPLGCSQTAPAFALPWGKRGAMVGIPTLWTLLATQEHPVFSKPPPGDPESCRRAGGPAEAAGGGGTGLSRREGPGGRGNSPRWDGSPGPPPTCCRFHVNISAFRTSNLSGMIGQIRLHREHSSNKVSAGTSAKKTSKLLSLSMVTVG